MTGSGLLDFLIVVLGLCLVAYLIYLTVDFITTDERFRKIGRVAIGGALVIAFLIAVKGVLFGGGGGALAVTPGGVIEFAIGLIVLLAVLFIIYMAVDFLAPAEFVAPIKLVVGALALIAILVLAERVLFGGGLGLANFGHNLQLGH